MNTPEDSISTIKDFVSYWDILIGILCMLIIVPFIYIGFLRSRTIPQNQLHLHFKGQYNAKDIIDHVEELESTLNKKFSKFKTLIELVDSETERGIRTHSEIINSIVLCIKLNGRKRLTVFWDSSDGVLKVLILLLPLISALIVIVSNIYFGLSGLIMSLIPMAFFIPVVLIIFSSFLKISQNIFRKKGRSIPALSLAFIALEALINTHIARSFDNETKQHFYYTKIHKYNNEVNSDTGFSKVYIRTSSEIYGSLEELTNGKN